MAWPLSAAAVSEAAARGMLIEEEGGAAKLAAHLQQCSPGRSLVLLAMQANRITLPNHDLISLSKDTDFVPVHKFWAALCSQGGPTQVGCALSLHMLVVVTCTWQRPC